MGNTCTTLKAFWPRFRTTTGTAPQDLELRAPPPSLEALPLVKILDGEVMLVDEYPFSGTAWVQIWRGQWFQEKVAVKRLRMFHGYNEKAIQRFSCRIAELSVLSHTNIMSAYGITTDRRCIEVISAWMENGDVIKYIKCHPEVDRSQLMLGASKGLSYLHACKVAHGRVKCSNILVSETGVPLVCDFAMAKLNEDAVDDGLADSKPSMSLSCDGSAIRWLAPEFILGDVKGSTFEGDVYSFGMTMLECATLKHPYAQCKREAVVIYEIVSRKRVPPRPSGPDIDAFLTDELWMLMNMCWTDAAQRPNMAEVTEFLQASSLQTESH